MVPEIYPKKFHNEYYQYPPKENDFVLSFSSRQIVCKDYENSVLLPTVKDFGKESLLYLFCIDDISYFLWLGAEDIVPDGCSLKDLQEVRLLGTHEDYLSIFTAWHLYCWYRDNKYCGRCGAPTRIGTQERNILCECGNMIFPKIMPAVIVGVRNGDKILMTRYANRAYKGWALIAGFIEIGETAEECVRREVKEEVGIDVTNISYFASQPWGVDQDLLLGFFCDAVGSEEIHIDNFELATGEWVPREDIPERKDLQSLTATMMEAFRRKMDGEKYIPGSIA